MIELREQIARLVDPEEWRLEDFARQTDRTNMHIDRSLGLADKILALIDKREPAPAGPVVRTWTEANKRTFIDRFHRDNAASLNRRQWGEWVNALPFAEFLAMCCMDEAEPKP